MENVDLEEKNLPILGDLPAEVDWRKHGAVTDVKDQGLLGDNKIFGVIAAIEGAWKIRNGDLISLSEQELLDCEKYNDPFKYAQDNAIARESDYKFTGGRSGTCQEKEGVVQIVGWQRAPRFSEEAMMRAVAKKPEYVELDVDTEMLHHYKSGVLHLDCVSVFSSNQGLVIVGYGTENGKKYWELKNSWGTIWGEKGFIRIERGNGGKSGDC